MHLAAHKVVDKAKTIAAHLLEASEDDLSFANGRFAVGGTDAGITIQEVAMAAYLADTRNAWTFVMLSPAQNAAVVDWLSANSKRPQAAVRLWSHLFTCMRMDTGEILKGREELAERLGILPRDLSSLMTELASINAVRREKRGREVRYFMNSTIATHLPSAEARAKAREADGQLLVVMQGGQSQKGSN